MIGLMANSDMRSCNNTSPLFLVCSLNIKHEDGYLGHVNAFKIRISLIWYKV